MTDTRSHLSIGEVLALLQDEYPDITISKIRFLESQGLLVPERTPSGYRKFHDEDIERLRWILAQQRDHFLPLKVIKERIEAGDLGSGPPDGVLPFGQATSSSEETAPRMSNETPSAPSTAAGETVTRKERAANVGALLEGPAPERPKRSRRRHPTGHTKGEPTPEPGDTAEDLETPSPEVIALTRDELTDRSGLDARSIDELERYGLLTTRSIGDDAFFDDDALAIARLAAGFSRYGIEPRHLRMYKVSAEREAGMFEQLIMPLLKQRRAAAREEAVEVLEDLAELADDLRAVMVRSALREYLGA